MNRKRPSISERSTLQAVSEIYRGSAPIEPQHPTGPREPMPAPETDETKGHLTEVTHAPAQATQSSEESGSPAYQDGQKTGKPVKAAQPESRKIGRSSAASKPELFKVTLFLTSEEMDLLEQEKADRRRRRLRDREVSADFSSIAGDCIRKALSKKWGRGSD